jgi:poly-gamma-glutamate synthesis protein (capsule biosynthesis protein)
VLVSAANNHIKDYGMIGINSTIRLLEESAIDYIGVSKDNKDQASRAIIYDKGGVSAGIYSCAENEFSIASDDEGGANGYDPLITFDHIHELRAQCDCVIVLFHAGREHYRYPSPELQRVCRKMVEKGASLVICQHSHCIGCKEDYKDGVIIYGQGNFLFDRLNRSEWDNGLFLSVNLKKSSRISIDYIPVERENGCIHEVVGEKKEEILGSFEKRSKEIEKTGFIEEKWESFCKEQFSIYCLRGLYGVKNKFLLAIDRRTKDRISRYLLRKRDHRLLLLNFLRCESIYESMLTILSDSFWKEKK